MRFPTMTADHRTRPVIPLVLESPDGTRALVDTGADVSLFPEVIAEALGLNLEGVPETPIRSPLGHAGTYRAVEVTLELRRFPAVLRWTGTVGFLPQRLTHGLLGTRGFFEFFSLHYDAAQQFLEILPSGSSLNSSP